ncbi:MAG: hypothetical protein V5B32_13585 [Candidatus Accumulibacter sp. UW26]|jgi:hypothetical protein
MAQVVAGARIVTPAHPATRGVADVDVASQSLLKRLRGDLFTPVATPIMGPFGFQAEQALGSSSINQQARKKGDLLMSNLIVVAYDDQFRAEEVRTRLRKLQQEYLIVPDARGGSQAAGCAGRGPGAGCRQ